jgi:hypothetical protein
MTAHLMLTTATYLVSTLDRCMMRDLPEPQGSMRYLEASTIPLTPPSITGPSGCSTDVSTMTQAPLGKSFLQDLTQIEECHWYSNILFFPHEHPIKTYCL